MAAVSAPTPKLDRYIIIHVATTCDEHGVYVTKDSAEVIELGWILLDTKSCEEVRSHSFLHQFLPLFSCRSRWLRMGSSPPGHLAGLSPSTPNTRRNPVSFAHC
jgi:hypothetical protein